MTSAFWTLLDLAIIALLGTTIGFAAVLNRRLAAWRQDRGEFERLIRDFTRAAERADAAIARLKAASEAAQPLETAILKVEGLRDDLSYLIERGEPLADRLMQAVRTARPTASGFEAARAEAEADETAEAPLDARARTKRELLRAIAALR
jgi:hypothetical protein